MSRELRLGHSESDRTLYSLQQMFTVQSNLRAERWIKGEHLHLKAALDMLTSQFVFIAVMQLNF